MSTLDVRFTNRGHALVNGRDDIGKAHFGKPHIAANGPRVSVSLTINGVRYSGIAERNKARMIARK